MADSYEAFMIKNKHHIDSLAVWDPLFNIFTYLSHFTHPKLHEESLNYLRYGAAKRIRLIWDNVRWMTINIPIKRETPLTIEETQEASLHLNSLYLNMRGALDNLAWALLWQIDANEAQRIEESAEFMKVGLFRRVVRSKLTGSSLLTVIENCRSWDETLKSKRDPVAHRLPLFVSPRLLNEGQTEVYLRIENEIKKVENEYLQKLQENSAQARQSRMNGIQTTDKELAEIDNIEKAYKPQLENLKDEQESLGKFQSVFGYSRKYDELLPIYPTLTDDCYKLCELSNAVIQHFNYLLNR